MTHNEFRELPPDQIFEIRFYYGDVKYGILVEGENFDRVYYIPRAKINELNQGRKVVKEIGEEVSLACISSCKSIGAAKKFKTPPNVTIHNPPVIKKLVILGAGASYDSAYGMNDDNLRPPLANSLFDDRFDVILMNYPGAYNFSSELAHTKDIEAFFQGKWENLKRHHDPITLSKIINVQYYLHDLFLQVSKKTGQPKRSNYNTLVNLAHEYSVRTGEHVLFVTFNYDLLLEEAMRRTLKYRIESLSDYVNHQDRKLLLFKPHGSCNFIRKLDASILEQMPSPYNVNSVKILSQLLHSRNISYDLINSKLKDQFELFDRDEVIHASDTQEIIMYLPQLLLPFKAKDDFVMPDEHTILLDSFLTHIDEILVIGWKGTEEKFQQLLNRKLSDKAISITTVTRGESSVKEEFQKSIPNATYKPDGNTFSEFMQTVAGNNKGLFG